MRKMTDAGWKQLDEMGLRDEMKKWGADENLEMKVGVSPQAQEFTSLPRLKVATCQQCTKGCAKDQSMSVNSPPNLAASQRSGKALQGWALCVILKDPEGSKQ